jgi:hypothetical protein
VTGGWWRGGVMTQSLGMTAIGADGVMRMSSKVAADTRGEGGSR